MKKQGLKQGDRLGAREGADLAFDMVVSDEESPAPAAIEQAIEETLVIEMNHEKEKVRVFAGRYMTTWAGYHRELALRAFTARFFLLVELLFHDRSPARSAACRRRYSRRCSVISAACRR